MNPIWILIGGAAVLYFLRTGSFAGFSFNGGNTPAADAEVFGSQTSVRVFPRQSTPVLAPTAAAPGDSPDFHNPNVAGPISAPISGVPIVPGHVDVQYAPVPTLPSYFSLGTPDVAPLMAATANTGAELPYAAPDVIRAGFTNPAPPMVYVPAPPMPVQVVDYAPASGALDPVIDYSSNGGDNSQGVPQI